MSISEVYNMPIIRPNTVSHDPARDKELSMFARAKQKATKRSITLEILVLIFATAYTVIHFMLSHGPFLLYSLYITGVVSVIATGIWVCFEIHTKSFISILKSFKGFIITLSVIVCISCDIVRLSLVSQSDDTIGIIINDSVWFASLFILMASDCIPSITTVTRFVAPVFIILNGIKTLLLDSNNADLVIVKCHSGAVTINLIQEMTVIQMMLFSAVCGLGYLDIKHEYFVLFDNEVLIKKILPLRDYAKDDTFISGRFSIKTSWIFVCMTLCVILSVGVFVWNNIGSDESLWAGVICNAISSVLMLIMFVVLSINHFDKSIVKYLLPQFRNNILLASIIIIIYCEVQVLIRNLSYSLFVINDMMCVWLYSIYIILLIASDVMKISYPIYFIVLLILVIVPMAVWNLYMLTCDESNAGFAKWFLVLKKEAYLQIIILCILILWKRIIADRENKHFVLIRSRKQCKELLHDEDLHGEYSNNLVMDNDNIYSHKL